MESLIAFWNRYRKTNILILKLLLFGILIYNLYSKFSGQDFHETLRIFENEFSIHKIHFLFLAICLTFFNWGFETLKYYICIQPVETISYWRAYRGILYGNALNLILPASIGELTGRPLVLKEENRLRGSGIAYYVSIVQKVASPIVGLMFLTIAYSKGLLSLDVIDLRWFQMPIVGIIVLISVLDISFWSWMYFFPKYVIHFLERFKITREFFEKIELLIHYPLSMKLKLLGIGCIRFLIFVTQYWILMFLFFDHFPHVDFYILCGVYFLAQFVIPSMGFLDVGIRANLVAFIFSMHTKNFLQLMAVNYLIWVINLLVPSLFGFFLMRKNIVDFDEKK